MMNTFNMHGHSKMVYVCGRSWELVNSSENTLEQIAFGGNWSKHKLEGVGQVRRKYIE